MMTVVGPTTTLNTQGRLRGEYQDAGGLEPKGTQHLLTQSIGVPPGNLLGE